MNDPHQTIRDLELDGVLEILGKTPNIRVALVGPGDVYRPIQSDLTKPAACDFVRGFAAGRDWVSENVERWNGAQESTG